LSSEEQNENQNSGNASLVKKITTTTMDGSYSEIVTDEYYYEDNKIERRLQYRSGEYYNSGEVYKTYLYTYTNNRIKTVRQFDSSETLEESYDLSYDTNGNLTSILNKGYYNQNVSYVDEYSFYYNDNKILACENDSYGESYNSRYTTNSNGDIVFGEDIQDCSFSSPLDTDESTFTINYDANPSPFKNIEGNNFYIFNFIDIFTYAEIIGFHNNVTNVFYSDDTTELVEWYEYTYDYNSNNYPRNIQVYEEGELFELIDIEYY
jgi:hypothetical protein